MSATVLTGYWVKVSCHFKLFLLYFIYKSQGLCLEGRFGANCEFMCHCPTPKCAKITGTCEERQACNPPQFGPGCQYKDLAYSTDCQTNNSVVLDHDDSTCTSDSNITSLVFQLKEKAPIYWIRVVGDDRTRMDLITVKFDDDQSCFKQQIHFFDAFIRDVTCSEVIMSAFIIFEGAIVKSLCSIYVSGGRNLALFQTVTQSSNFNQFQGTTSIIDTGVNLLVDRDQNSCMKTEYQVTPFVEIIFTPPVALVSVTVLRFAAGNNSITIELFNTENAEESTVLVWGNHSNVSLPMVPTKYSAYVKIRISSHLAILNLCDIQALGESICPPGTWGLTCNRRCQCPGSCFVSTGTCSMPCLPGKYGFGCKLKCPELCEKPNCTIILGRCLGCQPGYTGDKCKTKCSSMFYGKNCLEKCSEYCMNQLCDSKTGSCQCMNGYRGDKCTVCPRHTFGEGCNISCSELCLNQNCNEIGNCFLCPSGFSGDKCTTEVSGFVWLTKAASVLAAIIVFGSCVVMILYFAGKMCRGDDHSRGPTDTSAKTSVTQASVSMVASTYESASPSETRENTGESNTDWEEVQI